MSGATTPGVVATGSAHQKPEDERQRPEGEPDHERQSPHQLERRERGKKTPRCDRLAERAFEQELAEEAVDVSERTQVSAKDGLLGGGIDEPGELVIASDNEHAAQAKAKAERDRARRGRRLRALRHPPRRRPSSWRWPGANLRRGHSGLRPDGRVNRRSGPAPRNRSRQRAWSPDGARDGGTLDPLANPSDALFVLIETLLGLVRRARPFGLAGGLHCGGGPGKCDHKKRPGNQRRRTVQSELFHPILRLRYRASERGACLSAGEPGSSRPVKPDQLASRTRVGGGHIFG